MVTTEWRPCLFVNMYVRYSCMPRVIHSVFTFTQFLPKVELHALVLHDPAKGPNRLRGRTAGSGEPVSHSNIHILIRVWCPARTARITLPPDPTRPRAPRLGIVITKGWLAFDTERNVSIPGCVAQRWTLRRVNHRRESSPSQRPVPFDDFNNRSRAVNQPAQCSFARGPRRTGNAINSSR